MIPINAPVLGELEEKLVLEVLRSGCLVKGPMVARFEEAVREVVGTQHAVALNSGTSALIAALLANGIGPHDVVVTSPFTFVATVNAILLVGATPRFVDIGTDYTIDIDLVGDALDDSTRAVVPVDLFGCPADLRRLRQLCDARGVALVEDAAQALGAAVGGVAAGSFGTGCFSFYATKNVTAAEGGVVTTDSEDVATAVRVLADQGQAATYEYVRPGYNFRMSELHAAVGVAQMSRLDDVIERRRENAAFMRSALRGVEGLVLPEELDGRVHVFHQFTVRVTDIAAVARDELASALRRAGVACGVYYPRLVSDYACFRNAAVAAPRTPVAERFAREVLSLPVQPSLTHADLEHIVDTVRGVLT
jgi:dTDP-4-amino-4,6-dideoxygalactose transaminase